MLAVEQTSLLRTSLTMAWTTTTTVNADVKKVELRPYYDRPNMPQKVAINPFRKDY